jgi:glycosyltransferase involved in cell wall biosynthesis
MRISLITTTRNRADFLLNCAESVAAQSIKPYQWVIYIDDLMDSYKDTITRIEELLPNVILTIIGGEFIGRVKALNIAHASAIGDYFALLDDDDWLDPNCLLECTNRNIHSYDIIYTDFYTVNLNNQKYLGRRNQIPYSWTGMLTNNIMFHFKLYKASLYKQVGEHDESYETTMDYEITLRMLKLKPTILKINLPLYYYRVHNDSISGTKSDLQALNAARARAIYTHPVN